MREKITIELTKQEAEVFLGLLNKAVQAVGISDNGVTAKNAVYFIDKLNKAFETKRNGDDKISNTAVTDHGISDQ